jgi:hypothetical protein
MAAGGATYLAITTITFFPVQRVQVVGTLPPRDDEVRAAASSVLQRNIFTIDAAAVQADVAGKVSLKIIDVRTRFPDEVIVTVAEREPRGVWQAGNERFLVDDEGIVLGPAGPDTRLPTVRQVAGEPVTPGSRVSADAIVLAGQLGERTAQAIGANPTAFEWTADGGLLMRTDRGWVARFGGPEDLDYKLIVWRAILDRAGHEKWLATNVDLRFPTRPMVRS